MLLVKGICSKKRIRRYVCSTSKRGCKESKEKSKLTIKIYAIAENIEKGKIEGGEKNKL